MVIVYHMKMSLDSESAVTNTAPGVFSHVLIELRYVWVKRSEAVFEKGWNYFSVLMTSSFFFYIFMALGIPMGWDGDVGLSVHQFGWYCNTLTTIVMRFGTNINSLSLCTHLAPSSGHNFNCLRLLLLTKIPASTFPSASLFIVNQQILLYANAHKMANMVNIIRGKCLPKQQPPGLRSDANVDVP